MVGEAIVVIVSAVVALASYAPSAVPRD